RFAYNTVAYNKNASSGDRGGVTCLGANVAAQGNLIYKNSEGRMTSDATQSGGTCVFGNSLSLGSVAGNLGFKSPETAPVDFHFTAMTPSSVVDAGGNCTGVDFDGDTRPIGTACDLGADEYNPASP